jgi:lipopolysaccharide/colanic/teichoic acid biosynthesis glycosyltransferase
VKRIFDIIFSFLGLLVFSPVLIVAAIAVKIEDGGPVFYRAPRVGQSGIPFIMYKFRTMIVDAESNGPSSTSSDDIRITRTGLFLRKFKIDEIPQLLNVLIGNMSIVGPRPEIKKFTDLFTEEEESILNVKPGITDWASIWNSNEGLILQGAEDPDKAYLDLIRPEKIRLQLLYIKNHNFFIDLKIIFLTVRKIVFGK